MDWGKFQAIQSNSDTINALKKIPTPFKRRHQPISQWYFEVSCVGHKLASWIKIIPVDQQAFVWASW